MKRLTMLVFLLLAFAAAFLCRDRLDAQTITLNDAVNTGCTVSGGLCSRAGLNLGQASGDFPQFKNLIAFANPGFEPQQVQQIYQFAVNPCTFCSATQFQWNVSNSNFSGYATNQWAGANFSVVAGCYPTMTGCSGGYTSDPAYGCTGTIASSSANTGGFGPQFVINSATNQGSSGCAGALGIPGQVIIVSTNSSMSNVGPPASNGWPQTTISTSGTATVTAETSDLCASCGTQSVDFNSGTGTISMTLRNTTFTEGGALKTITLNGSYTVKFWAKSVSGSTSALTFTLTARNGNCANPSPCTFNPTLTTSWAQYTHTFALTESTSPTSAFAAGLAWTVATGAEVRFDNIEFDDPSTNPTAWSDNFVNALKAYCQTSQNTTGPGCTLRYGPSPDSETMANWTKSLMQASPSVESSGSNNNFTQASPAGSTGYFTVKPRIFDFLQLCQQVGATPVLIVPITFTTTDFANLVDYLEDNAGGTTYGAIRQAQGQSTAWVGQGGSPFGVIYLELGNENWNGLFLGHALFGHANNPNNYFDYANWVGTQVAAARARQGTQSYSTSATKWMANMQTGSTTDLQYLTAFFCGQTTYSGGTITCTRGGQDGMEYQQYYATNINSVSNANCTTGGSTNNSCLLYGPTLTEPWSDYYDASSTSGAAQSLAKIPTITSCGPSHNVACLPSTYERAIYSTGNVNFTQTVSDTFEQTGWHTAADAGAYLGANHNSLAYIDEYASQAYFLSDGGVNVHKYGAMIDAGGDTSVTNSALFGGSYTPRPQMGAAMVNNYCQIGQEKTTTGTSIPTYTVPTNSNGVHVISGVPVLDFAEYAFGTKRCLIIVNRDIFSSYTVTLAGTNVPSTVTQYQQAPSSPTATNEATALNSTSTTAATVYPVLTTNVSVVNGFTAPPTSTSALLWDTGAVSVAVDFNSRSGGTTVGQNIFGTNITNLSSATPLNSSAPTGDLFSPIGMNVIRLFVSENQLCPAGSCAGLSSSALNSQLTLIKKNPNLQVLLAFYQTDSSLGASTCTPPTSASTWATNVGTIISFVQSNFATVPIAGVTLRNEPDLTTDWCPGTGTNLSNYETFIATVGPQLKTAFPSLKIGMPSLAAPASNAATWIPGVLGSWATPDFIDYHLYLGSQASWAAYWSAMQNTSSGIGFYYNTMVGLAGSIPVWVTETNNNSAFSSDCCRNDASFGPLWNTLMAADYLNPATYSSTTVPPHVLYYSDQSTASPNFFCLVGTPSTTNCDVTTLSPYPQWYAYQLLNSSTMLNLSAGGHLATSNSPGATTASLTTAAWYTSRGDHILIVNPTASDATSIPVTISNAGITGAHATQFLLNSSNSTITTSSLALIPSGGGYSATVTVPANSTLGITVSGATSVSISGKTRFSGKVTIQ